jgi:hypothetical protein
VKLRELQKELAALRETAKRRQLTAAEERRRIVLERTMGPLL